METKPNRKAKDSVFTHLFHRKEYALQLYKVLHPEAVDVTEDDINCITLQNIFTTGPYNDFSMIVKDQLIIMVEAQSTWNSNMTIRLLMYMADTYQRYIVKNRIDLFSSVKAMIPKPEFYVVYTGSQKKLPEFMQLSSHFMHLQKDEDPTLQLKLKVVYTSKKGDILYQYIMFCKVLTEQYELTDGDLMEAIKKTIEICKDEGYLKDYFEEHETEACKTIFKLLHDETLIMELHDAQLTRQTAQQIALKLMASGVEDATIMQSTQLTAGQLADLREHGEEALRIL